jgi:hypothetical protein
MPPGAGSSSARDRLQQSAAAHGLAAWRGLHDINIGCSRLWPPLPDVLPGALPGALSGVGDQADAPVELRLLPGAGLTALALGRGAGSVQVLRRQPGSVRSDDAGSVQLWTHRQPSADPAALAAAARLADGQRLVVLGPLALADATSVVHWGAPDTLDGRRCDQLLLDLVPGLGGSPGDRLALFIDREQGLLRRLRLARSAPGMAGGPVVEVDFQDHITRHGVVWPRRMQSPAPLPGAAPRHWRLSGLDVDRGYPAEAVSGPQFGPPAALPARALPD